MTAHRFYIFRIKRIKKKNDYEKKVVDTFEMKEHAELFVRQLKERYPNREYEIWQAPEGFSL
jgi:hypothetical protein